jgi:hypothetical protein
MPQPNKKMVVGFNHNIKHKGNVYHVQTEDSGVDNPHVITHLFVGGNILASKRASYRSLIGFPDLEVQVRAMMEAQHKEMLKNLVGGAFEKMEAQLASKSFQPGELAGGATAGAKVPPPPQAATAPTLTEEGIGSIFAEDLISEKSLDEVILSYLAGEGETK